MEGGTLFNPGFLGANFLWWVGQIADDSTWRDNITPGIHKSKDSIPGWGRRYKVRIIGLHDKEEETIPSDQLPWAQVMYPVTGGGGQTNSGQTSNLRQGMFVFGFFLDGQDQQVPVIMGVLGNNSQTALATRTGTTASNFAATSGNATGQVAKTPETQEKVPDYGKEVEKPKPPEIAQLCAAPPPNVQLNQFGLRPDIAQSKTVFQIAQSARAQLETDPQLQGLNSTERENFVQQRVADGIRQQCAQANSANSSVAPGATIEQVDSVHKLSAAHVKREDKMREPIPLMKPDDKVGSALKNIQTILDKITQKIDKYLRAINSYIEAVTNTISNIQSLIASAACEIAKYIKLIFDQIMEYVLKKLNCALTKVVSAMPVSMRHLFGDIKEILTELILCLYNKMTQNICGVIEGLLSNALQPEDLERRARAQIQTETGTLGSTTQIERSPSTPNVPICYAEDLAADAIFAYKQEITDTNNTILDNVNAFLNDIQGELSGVSGALSDITALLGNISGSIGSALSFESLKLDIFGCELKPNIAVADYYTFARGGAGQPDSQLPNVNSIEKSLSNKTETPTIPTQTTFAEPTRATPDLDYRDYG